MQSSNPAPSEPPNLPLVIDLDRSFSRVDTLAELGFSLAISRPHRALGVLLRSRSQLEMKRRLFDETLHLSPIPIEPQVESMFIEAKRLGRKTVLATGSIPQIADYFADQVGGGFDVVLSSSHVNLSGQAKADLLVKTFGKFGFDYVGDSRKDLPALAVASSGFLVGSDIKRRAFEKKLGKSLKLIRREFRLQDLLTALRPVHWIKNLLVFMAPLLALNVSPESVGRLILAFAGLSCIASALYLVNDIGDVWSDRLHPDKRLRPIASGRLGAVGALALSALLALVGFLVFTWIGGLPGFAIASVYSLSSLVYSSALKQLPLVDAISLAWMYVLRILIGAYFAYTPVSSWLLVLAFLTFLSLALLKRAIELDSLTDSADGSPNSMSKRGYKLEDRRWVGSAGISIGVSTLLVLALYVMDRFNPQETMDLIPMLLIPVWSMWIMNFWLDQARGRVGADPVRYALLNKRSITLALLMILLYSFSVISLEE